MTLGTMRNEIEHVLSDAGVQINGDRPWDIQIHNDRLFGRVLAHGNLGLGEAYMDGWWDCARLDEFFHRVLSAGADTRLSTWVPHMGSLTTRMFNLQKPSRAFEIGERHYDAGNDLFSAMLGKRMMYGPGRWENSLTLDEAQEHKLEIVCRKLDLQPGMKVLDIGCGWGGAAQFAAERYKVRVVGLTVSREQADHAKERCQGLPVEIRLQDYRELNETFDRILSLGMFEHVGYKNYRRYMEVVKRCLSGNGRFLLHTIGNNLTTRHPDPWIEKYVFPNSLVPSGRQIFEAMESLFVMEDWQCAGPDYDKTLMCWHRNFDAAWPRLRPQYGDRFYRMWTYYLLSCAGAFRARALQLWQILLSAQGIPNGYHRSAGDDRRVVTFKTHAPLSRNKTVIR